MALPQSHGLRASIERHKGRLNSELKLARLRAKAPTIEELRAKVERDSAGEEKNYPRWVRINSLKTTVEDELSTTFKNFTQTQTIDGVVNATGKCILIDSHVPNLIAITPGTDLSKTEAYSSGKVIFQDKASCFPAYLLDPRSEDGDVIDACAAPGNKTTHLAAIIHNHQPEFEAPPQTIYAFEKDSRRAQTLEKMVKIAGSKNSTKIGLGQDFLRVDPASERYRNVGALLLDPSCSGSGIVGRDSMPEVHLPDMPGQPGKGKGNQGKGSKKHGKSEGSTPAKNDKKRKHEKVEDTSDQILVDDDGNETVVKSEKDLQARLEALSSFQLTLLLHAFKFPAARRVTYSTCSVHDEENERVVMKALQSTIAKARGWRILKRSEQVRGMRDWPVRGVLEASEGDKDVADGCIRSYKDDGFGVMGFFVAGFVRDGNSGNGTANGGALKEEEADGPYVRDEDGRIVRDMIGMPVLKETGLPVELNGRDEMEEEKADSAESTVPSSEDGASESDSDSDSQDEEEEWGGFED